MWRQSVKSLRSSRKAAIARASFNVAYEFEDAFSSFSLPSPPEPVLFPRKMLNLKFAVLLMRSAYEAVDALDFIPMDKFQIKVSLAILILNVLVFEHARLRARLIAWISQKVVNSFRSLGECVRRSDCAILIAFHVEIEASLKSAITHVSFLCAVLEAATERSGALHITMSTSSSEIRRSH
jgi:hypothetical protein